MSCHESTPQAGLTLGDNYWPRAKPWLDLLNSAVGNNHTYDDKRTSLNFIKNNCECLKDLNIQLDQNDNPSL